MIKFLLILIFLIPLPSCGGEEETDTSDEDGPVIVIGSGNIFATPDIEAPSEGVITIINNDDSPHSITSQSAEDAFDDTGDFDVAVPSESVQILTLPMAAPGDVFFYYDKFFEDGMNPANGMITIE